MTTQRRIGLFGGTFDPIHRGHLETLCAAQGHFSWDEIVLVVARQQPFKTGRRSASAFHRHAMAVLATEADPLFRVSTFELERPEISYTVDTLEYFTKTQKDAALDWIIGDDNLAQLPAWKAIDRIFELANFVVLRRDASAALPAGLRSRETTADRRGRAGSIIFAENPIRTVSSTEIRSRIANGRAIGDLVDARVERYIQRYGLYQGEA